MLHPVSGHNGHHINHNVFRITYFSFIWTSLLLIRKLSKAKNNHFTMNEKFYCIYFSRPSCAFPLLISVNAIFVQHVFHFSRTWEEMFTYVRIDYYVRENRCSRTWEMKYMLNFHSKDAEKRWQTSASATQNSAQKIIISIV